jgi:hypothetical protein
MISQQLLKLIEQNGLLIGRLSIQTIQMLAKLWTPYRNWTDHDLTLAQAARSATTIDVASRSARSRERMFHRFLYKELGLKMPENDVIDSDGGLSVVIQGGVDLYMREGVTPLDVYQRPAEEYRYWVSTGMAENEALAKTIERVSKLADTDLSLSRRDEARRVFRNSGETIIGYRRIIHPELSETGFSCGLCVVASTRIYHTADLLPIHDLCNCDVLPITRSYDPGKELNDLDLARVYEGANGSTSAKDLLNTKVHFLEHGELGPIISGGNRSRQGAKQRAASKARKSISPEESIDAQIHSLTKSSENLIRRQQGGEENLQQAINWQRDRILNLQRQLATLRRNV